MHMVSLIDENMYQESVAKFSRLNDCTKQLLLAVSKKKNVYVKSQSHIAIFYHFYSYEYLM